MMTKEQEHWAIVRANLELCKFSLLCAERINWGRHVHTGLRLLAELKPLYAELDSRPMMTTHDELIRMSKLRQAVCDIMWQVEHKS